jgi:hypothetical protein
MDLMKVAFVGVDGRRIKVETPFDAKTGALSFINKNSKADRQRSIRILTVEEALCLGVDLLLDQAEAWVLIYQETASSSMSEEDLAAGW